MRGSSEDPQARSQGDPAAATRPDRPTRVVYVSGTGRSGSTLLGNAIGSLPGALSVGEVKLGFRRGVAEGGTCGCRLPVVLRVFAPFGSGDASLEVL